jgi:hypothetical protein
MDRTFVMVKPDGVARGLIGEVVGRLETKGLRSGISHGMGGEICGTGRTISCWCHKSG